MTGSCPVSALACRETARERDELRAEVERLRAAIEALHHPEPFHDDPSATFCAHCQRTAGVWPCPTAALLDPTGGETDERNDA